MTTFLTEEQTRELNDIYARVMKKYTSSATDSINLGGTVSVTFEEALGLAGFELQARQVKILEDYAERVNAIEANAIKRGLEQSTIVIELLDKALVRKNDALARLEDVTDKLAKKIFNDNQKLALSVEREKSISKSRSLRDYIAHSRMKLTVSVAVQAQIDEELYLTYLEWLLKFEPMIGRSYLQSNPLFLYNLGATQYTRLGTEMNRRVGNVL